MFKPIIQQDSKTGHFRHKKKYILHNLSQHNFKVEPFFIPKDLFFNLPVFTKVCFYCMCVLNIFFISIKYYKCVENTYPCDLFIFLNKYSKC